MEIKINPAWPVSDIGGKPNQEDRIYPYEESINANGLPTDIRCFVLCDGMGGHENGEVAAEIVSHTLQPALTASAATPDIMSVERFEKALKATYDELDTMEVTQGKRPGTTMTCVYLAENGVFVAHIGDSRIYQVRPGTGVVFRTMDHSLVNELVRAGEITEEEAAHHPRRNIITRAMQPGLETPFRADTKVITDVKAGDYFFMCSDGVLENLTDEKLVEILSKDITDKEKLDEIFYICFGNTRDNFSAVLIPIASVTGEPLPTPEPVKPEPVKVVTPVTTPDPVTQPAVTPAKQPSTTRKPCKKSQAMLWILATVALVAVAAAAYVLGTKNADEDATDTKPGIVKTDGNQSVRPDAKTPTGRADDDDDDADDEDGKDENIKDRAEDAVEDLTEGFKETLEDAAKTKLPDQKADKQNLGTDALKMVDKAKQDAQADPKPSKKKN